ncbi:hypothetical protein AMELA_G00215730 [Ameiurus melas]|uniref:Uncharacterized protein n=1 Tax=Ameiurus melas TaxID=219545 RepID=A0A7J6A3I9_AMEME|nr:hypothetical protein AMELA_G00215730 [Ameiurus melas]
MPSLPHPVHFLVHKGNGQLWNLVKLRIRDEYSISSEQKQACGLSYESLPLGFNQLPAMTRVDEHSLTEVEVLRHR